MNTILSITLADILNMIIWLGDVIFVYTVRAVLLLVATAIACLSFFFMVMMLPILWGDFWRSWVPGFWPAVALVVASSLFSGFHLMLVTLSEVEWFWNQITRIKPAPRPRRSTILALPAPYTYDVTSLVAEGGESVIS